MHTFTWKNVWLGKDFIHKMKTAISKEQIYIDIYIKKEYNINLTILQLKNKTCVKQY